jgi:hypothetical protein
LNLPVLFPGISGHPPARIVHSLAASRLPPDNGESLLAGEMTLVDGKFEGRWTSGGGDEAGRLTMRRKAT